MKSVKYDYLSNGNFHFLNLKMSLNFPHPSSLYPGTISLLLLAGQHQKAIWAFYHALILPDVPAGALDNFLLYVPHSVFSGFL